MSATHPLDEFSPLDRAVARAAAAWLVRLREGASPEDMAACEHWRAADPQHERAWQRALRLNEKFRVVPPAVGVPVLGREVRIDRRAALKALTALLVATPASYVAWREAPWREWVSDERTATGERRSITLADGTRVDLNTATALDIVFSDTERRLVLNAGEIQVETGADTRDPSATYRPFIVQTRQGRIRALGTRFVVRKDRDDDSGTRVAVLESAVEVTPARAEQLRRIISAGEQTRFTAIGSDAPGPADPHLADWTRGVLFADRMRLGDFAAEVGRYRTGVLRCDPAVADLRITGAFQLDNTDSILTALPDTLPVSVVYRTRYWVSIVAPAAAGVR